MANFDVDHKEVECNCFERIKELEYSILSHRWGDREVTFSHLQTLHEQLSASEQNLQTTEKLALLRANRTSITPSKSSIDKLSNFLKRSAEKQCRYAWADTVCIDKGSSAELDESIRSMYAWYRNSRICIVYLSRTTNYVDMEQDPWFRRGWTLQELLAPMRLAFYSKEWKQITTSDSLKHPTKEVESRAEEDEDEEEEEVHEDEDPLWLRIAAITKIKLKDLHNFKSGLYDIRKRMTWVANRKTTRIEDMAYCLIGIFDVNLPIAYGEKEKAFYRLQVEILQNSDDMSLFDWQGEASMYSSMLAASPACFSTSIGLRADDSLRAPNDSICTQTSIGIRIPPPVYHLDRQGAQQSSELPDGAIAFSILGSSPKPNHNVILVLGVGARRGQYKRLALIEQQLERDSSKQISDAVFVK